MSKRLLTPDQYMDLLLERQAAYLEKHPPRSSWARPLIDWFIEPGDELIVDVAAMAEPPPKPAPAPKPRQYRSAASWRVELEAAIKRRDAAYPEGLPDRAAATGQGIGRKRALAHAKRVDNALARYVRLDNRVKELEGRVARAEYREAQAAR